MALLSALSDFSYQFLLCKLLILIFENVKFSFLDMHNDYAFLVVGKRRCMELQKILGANVRHHRKSIGWTLEHLAGEVGVSRETIGKIERGISAPLFETVEKIASALGVSPQLLFGAASYPPGERGRLLSEINSILANLNEKQLSRAQRLLDTLRGS